jgi:predicted pyridoxine 5'-phosphate oxidase superfamily flavin-nucleotide-binding protein
MGVVWISRSPFLMISTSAVDGSCDVSPKGDPAGFVHVLDERTIAVPERPGNRRVDGYRNVSTATATCCRTPTSA